ncbi:MAG: hypothetical protein E3J52_10390 [Promethearchaeota archaeon]|nr:MAG: hypothetical protein E3J52_10390 [Candidatus Lokiarchaeota archaeon]
MLTNKPILQNKLFDIINANTIKDLLDIYEMMLNTPMNLSEIELERVERFITDINNIRCHFSKGEIEYKNQFDKDQYLIDILKKNLMDLYANSKSKSYRYNYGDMKINNKGFDND